jgi:hypothetical protein
MRPPLRFCNASEKEGSFRVFFVIHAFKCRFPGLLVSTEPRNLRPSDGMSFMTDVTTTSDRLHCELVHLLFLQAYLFTGMSIAVSGQFPHGSVTIQV